MPILGRVSTLDSSGKFELSLQRSTPTKAIPSLRTPQLTKQILSIMQTASIGRTGNYVFGPEIWIDGSTLN